MGSPHVARIFVSLMIIGCTTKTLASQTSSVFCEAEEGKKMEISCNTENGFECIGNAIIPITVPRQCNINSDLYAWGCVYLFAIMV